MSLVPLAPRHVGWRTEAGVVAEARFEREDGELTLVALEYADAAEARSMLDAIEAAATAPRILGAVDGLEQFGFVPENGRLVREVRLALPEQRTPPTLAALEEAIRSSWTRETSEDAEEWTPENPALGQCGVTALVVRDYLGGDLVIAGVVRDGIRVDRHVWNRLPSGLEIDLSRDQFRAGEQYERPEPLTEATKAGTTERYELLAARVRARIEPSPARR